MVTWQVGMAEGKVWLRYEVGSLTTNYKRQDADSNFVTNICMYVFHMHQYIHIPVACAYFEFEARGCLKLNPRQAVTTSSAT